MTPLWHISAHSHPNNTMGRHRRKYSPQRHGSVRERRSQTNFGRTYSVLATSSVSDYSHGAGVALSTSLLWRLLRLVWRILLKCFVRKSSMYRCAQYSCDYRRKKRGKIDWYVIICHIKSAVKCNANRTRLFTRFLLFFCSLFLYNETQTGIFFMQRRISGAN